MHTASGSSAASSSSTSSGAASGGNSGQQEGRVELQVRNRLPGACLLYMYARQVQRVPAVLLCSCQYLVVLPRLSVYANAECACASCFCVAGGGAVLCYGELRPRWPPSAPHEGHCGGPGDTGLRAAGKRDSPC